MNSNRKPSKLIFLLVFFLPISLSARWRPKYWSIYGDFSGGINYTEWKYFMVSGSANLTVNYFYSGLNLFSLAESGARLNEYSFNAGIQLIDRKYFFGVAGPGLGYVSYYGRRANSIAIEKAFSYPVLAKFYYTPAPWIGFHAQVFYSFNSLLNYWGATAGISLGLFHWTNIKYMPSP